ncbi:MAG: hypothetical protein ABI448_07365 [Bacteroidia bacterium]
MKILCFILCFISLQLAAQSNRFLSLDIERPGTTKRIKYYDQDKIVFKIKGSRHKYKGIMVALTDSSFTLDSTKIILLKNIRKVMVDKSNHLTRAACTFISGCGIGYMGLDALNNAINSNTPVFRTQTLEIGAGLIIVGQSFKIFSLRRYTINKKHRLKFIDDTP